MSEQLTTAPLTPEEKYRYEERLAILCADNVPSQIDMDLAMGDVRRFRSEQEESNYEN